MIVKKISGKPFKSGRKFAIVSGTIEKEVMSGTLPGSTPDNIIKKKISKLFYTFSNEEDGYCVPVCQCEEVILQ
jgi:hypothetical protein